MQRPPFLAVRAIARHLKVVFALHVALFVALAALAAPARAADPLDAGAVPELLKPWTAWVLDGKEDALCPTFHDHADLSRCAWPSRLSLTLDERGGRFSQTWHLDAKHWVPLPGDEKRWPSDVRVDGKRAIVGAQGGAPSVELDRGEHEVTGAFAWDSPPESLKVPPETGLLTLRLRGATIASPNRDGQGTVWLQKAATNEEGEALELVVHRKVTDDIPLVLTTRIELHVSGKNREELLGRALPDGFVPMALDSPLPARIEPDGRLRVQVRPGVFTLELTARAEGVTNTLKRPSPGGPWREGDEVWTFEAKNDYRVVTVEGVPSIDPAQTTLPDAWKKLPTFPMKLDDTMRLVEKRRGDADPPPDQLSLVRQLWLDFDGAGFTVSDQLTGALHRDSRLEMAPPTVLGRASIGGRDQFITHLADASRTGVEVRQGQLVVNADSRITSNGRELPAVSWAHDFHQVTGTLHLPPGWRLLHATGVDDVPGTWVHHWSLLELFLALLITIGIGRLYGWAWSVPAIVMLALTFPEADAPRWSWLFVLAIEAIHRVLPPGRVKRLFHGARAAAALLVAIVTIPFLVQHVREGMYPALASADSVVGAGATADTSTIDALSGGTGTRAKGEEGSMGAVAVVPEQAAAELRDQDGEKEVDAPGNKADEGKVKGPRGAASTNRLAYRQSNAQVYDPAAIVQTGPGLPAWNWTTLDLRWSGPVSAAQRVHLYLLSPQENLLLAYARALLLLLVILRILPWTPRFFGRGGGGARGVAAAIAAFAIVFAPTAARADEPSKEMLDELQSRLLRKPSCSPTCATSGRMAIEVRGGVLRERIDVDASAATAVPLTGTSAQWAPADVVLDGKEAKGLVRLSDGVLWLELGAGAHTIALSGPMPDREAVQLPLHMKPHRVEAVAEGWTVEGLHEDGLADDNVQLTRIRKQDGGAGAALQPGALPPFVRVERTLQVGLNWQVDTRIVRATPVGAAVVLEVPLLSGESVTTADVRVVGGKALVNMGPQATEVAWHSVLEQRSPVKLTAPRSLAWSEVWRVDVGPIWHASFAGIPSVHAQAAGDVQVPEWRPWPGEEVSVVLVRPDGVPGQTLTIDKSTTDIRPGLRATDVTLTLSLRSSRGAQHTLSLPEGAELESLSINGATQPIRQVDRAVTVPIVPGAQTVVLAWREPRGIATTYAASPVDVGAPNVNATTTIAVPGGRWLLLAGGPRVGPAVLFWSLLLVLLVVAVALGRNRWTPLRTWHWLLVAIGLSQIDVLAGATFVGWLIALGWRSRDPGEHLRPFVFNLRQLALIAWTIVALGILGASVYGGLLGAPAMQVRGNGSTYDLLRWFTDRSGATLPTPWIISVPLLAYRGAMLAWALWIALALLRWLRWGWTSFTSGGGWKASPRVAPIPFVPSQGAYRDQGARPYPPPYGAASPQGAPPPSPEPHAVAPDAPPAPSSGSLVDGAPASHGAAPPSPPDVASPPLAAPISHADATAPSPAGGATTSASPTAPQVAPAPPAPKPPPGPVPPPRPSSPKEPR